MTPEDNRRRARRILASLPVTLSVFVPEISVVPQSFPGHSVDLSDRGILAEVELPTDFFAAINGQRRVVRVQFPGSEFQDRLIGHLAWSEQVHHSVRLLSRLGVFFEELDETTRLNWIRFLSQMSSISKR